MRVSVLALLAGLFVLGLKAQCLNDCSGAGSCVEDACVCVAGRGGEDCSFFDKELTSHVSLPGQEVPTRQFRYFHVDVSKVATVTTNVLQTSSGGDIDTYVKVGGYPDKNNYDAKDITSSRNVTIRSEGVTGTLYVGLYGYISATATVTVTVLNECPNFCSFSGTCQDDGTCSCFDGHTGDDCSISIVSLSNNQTVSGSVSPGQWQFYEAIHVQNQHDVVQFVINQKESFPAQNCDLYVKYFFLPALNFYDYRDVGTQQQFKISISSPREGHYYAGVYGQGNCDYDITLFLVAPECPNKCSGPTHGTCDEITYECTCSSQFTGDACETMISALGYNMPTLGYVGDNAWNYYTLHTFTSSNTKVTLTQMNENSTADCDLYLARGRQPSFFDFDYRDISYSSQVEILVVGSGVNTFQIGVHGYSACQYSLLTTLVRSCPNDCTSEEQGTCMDGTCACKTGWTGNDCSQKLDVLENGADVISTISGGSWKYYVFKVFPGTKATIYLRESLSVGYIWLFASPVHANSPSLVEHDVSDTETGKAVHSISISTTYQTDYIIGVHGSALAIPGTNYEFSLVAYQPRF